ncbi:hypothetical protein BC829DRAFT_436739 [Chytridium lagenaria]|nr:hypothetical protein BC829DRAFT_436739 [Chytridium lagenaria]
MVFLQQRRFSRRDPKIWWSRKYLPTNHPDHPTHEFSNALLALKKNDYTQPNGRIIRNLIKESLRQARRKLGADPVLVLTHQVHGPGPASGVFAELVRSVVNASCHYVDGTEWMVRTRNIEKQALKRGKSGSTLYGCMRVLEAVGCRDMVGVAIGKNSVEWSEWDYCI